MSKRLKESGHSFRVKKKKKEEEAASLSGYLNRFLITSSNANGETTEKEANQCVLM